MDNQKKPFSETGLGAFIKRAAQSLPEIAGAALDIVSGDVGGAIDNIKAILGGSDRPEAKLLLNEMKTREFGWRLEMERLQIETLKIDADDRANARARENEFTKTGKEDVKQYVVLAVGLGAFIFAIIATVFIEVPESNATTWNHLMGVIEGAAAIPIFTYFFGSSAGSKKKTDIMSSKG